MSANDTQNVEHNMRKDKQPESGFDSVSVAASPNLQKHSLSLSLFLSLSLSFSLFISLYFTLFVSFCCHAVCGMHLVQLVHTIIWCTITLQNFIVSSQFPRLCNNF